MKHQVGIALGVLRHRLRQSGFTKLRMNLSDDGELVEFSFQFEANGNLKVYENTYASLLRILAEAGFQVGFEELALNINGIIWDGAFLVRPLAEICRCE